MVTPCSPRSVADVALAAFRPSFAPLACGLVLVGCVETTAPPPPPGLETVTPHVGARSTTVTVALTGTNFVADETTVSVSGTGVTATNLAAGGATLLGADFVIDAAAATGDREVTVTTPGGTSAARIFTILPAAPTLAAVSPNVGARGSTVQVTLTGTDFVSGGTTVAVSGDGITVGAVDVSNTSTLTANFVIEAGASLGEREVTVATASGTTQARIFTVNPETPTVASVSPASGVQGTTVAGTIIGANFVSGATTVAVTGSGLTIGNVSVTSATSLTADFAIGSDAALGSRDVTVTTAGGTSGALTFTVNPPEPALTELDPASGVQGTTVAVALTGTNFVIGGTTVAVSGSNLSVSNVSVTSGTSLTADFVIGADAASGSHDVTVTTAGGTTGAQIFTVVPPAPVLTAVSPTSGIRGTTVSVTLTGMNFVSDGTTVAVSGAEVTVNNISVTSGTSLTADFVIGADAALGSRDVTVTTAGGTTVAQTFTINAPAPTVTAIGPTAAVQGTTVAMSLLGTNFIIGATTVAAGGSDIVVSNVNVRNEVWLTADFTIASDAALGHRAITVTTAGGTSAGQLFIVNPPAPTLTAASPASGVQGTTVAVTLTGTNFIPHATTVAVSGLDVIANSVNVTSGTSLTVNLVIGSTAAAGSRNVTATTAGGTTGAQTFTVTAATDPQEIVVQPSRSPSKLPD